MPICFEVVRGGDMGHHARSVGISQVLLFVEVASAEDGRRVGGDIEFVVVG